MSILAGKRILLVEDEVIIAMMLEDMVVELGGVPVGPATTCEAGMEFAENEQLDAAVLDVNLGDCASTDIADILARRAIPFILATGYGAGTLNTHGVPVLQKPYLLTDLENIFSKIL